MCNNPVWLIFDLILEREKKNIKKKKKIIIINIK